MPDTTAQQPKSEVEGGFRIEVNPGELCVTVDHAREHPLRLIVLIPVCVTSLMLIVESLRSGPPNWWIPVLGGISLAAILTFVVTFGRDRNLRCTSVHFTLVEVRRGRTLRTTSWPRSEINDLRYGVVAQGRGSSVYGLLFTADGRERKALVGLQAVEARRVLSELRRLGYEAGESEGMAELGPRC
jgi:hypothetical protein